MLVGTLFGSLVAIAISWTLARRIVPFRLRFEPAVWRQYFVTGLPIAGSHILSMAMLRGDTLLLSLFKPASEVGLYGVPTKMFELTTSLPYMFAGLMMPLLTAAVVRQVASGGGGVAGDGRSAAGAAVADGVGISGDAGLAGGVGISGGAGLAGAVVGGAGISGGAGLAGAAGGASDVGAVSDVSGSYARPTSTEFSRLLGRSLDAMLMYGVGGILALSVFAPELLSFISGPEFAAGAPALIVLSFAALLTALSIVLRFSLIALDRPRSVLAADGASCAIAVIAYLILIPYFSFVGAAIGTALAEASVLFAMLWGVQLAGQPLPKMTSVGKTLAAGLTAAAAIWLMSRLSLHWMLALLIGGSLYLGLLALTGAVPREFVQSLLKRTRTSNEIQSGDSQRTG
jgi:O-antigen/teichoic acid export membrane protein